MGKGKRNNDGNKNEEEKKEEGKVEERKKEQNKKITEVVLKVYMHCEGCKTKVYKCLKTFHGVEEVEADMGNQKVVIKGKELEPMKLLEKIKKKHSKNVEIISPIIKPHANNNAQPKKEEIQVKTVELKMNMHCEGCVKDTKQSIGKIKGVMTVEANKESSTVIVKGAIDEAKLVESIKKKMGKHAEICVGKMKKNNEKENKQSNKKDSCNNGGTQSNENGGQDRNSNFVFKYPPQYSLTHIYPNQTFSDDNVFSCSIM